MTFLQVALSSLLLGFYLQPTLGSGRENKFCKQTKVSTIFNLGEVVYTQMMDGQWEWWEDGRSEVPLPCKQPRRERSLRQLFFLDLDPNVPGMKCCRNIIC